MERNVKYLIIGAGISGLTFANYADVKQYQKQRGMEHSTMAITYASRKKKIILAA